ncbi:M23 family metallopeptidase, partial [Micromonospora sp. NPDC094482]|uniref:M23 family metallopeptidase n=1 Tax=unclassified Micromonospora TaxID=2617518 RepID=UPI00331919AE
MSVRALLRTFVLSCLAVLAALPTVAVAHAADPRPLFQLPFACGETWWLTTYTGHDDYDIDMFATSGATDNRPILASFAGTVAASGWDNYSGNYVKLRHGDDWETLYLHMKYAPMVSVGQSVRRGQQLGNVGSTGESGSPHLHYEQRVNGNKTQSYFNGVASGITHNDHSYSVTRTSANCASGTASIYGVLPDGRLTYTAVDAATGSRRQIRI